MAIQKRNDEMVNLLASDFQRRYEPQFAWGNAVSMFLQLPGLRGFWPMSAVDSSGNAQDQSGHAHHLTYTGNPVYGLDLETAKTLAPYIRFDGTGDYLTRTDEADLDITGTETYFESEGSDKGARMGLTLGGWFYPEDDTNDQNLISKWDAASNERSYALNLMGSVANDPVAFYISDDGTNTDNVTSTATTTMNTWAFVAARFNDADSGTEQAIWYNGTKTTDTTARASVHSGTADFLIGGQDGGSGLFTGRASLCFLCAAALPDVVLWALYYQTRALFGV